ncbi:MAG: DUF2855 family protein [Chitinophagales bacterium]
MIDFLVSKKNLFDCHFAKHDTPKHEDLKEGEVLLKINNFSFTANNITYAALGNSFLYWDFFSKGEEWGRIPCWGFADIVASNAEGLEIGERLYGYYPMSSYLKVKAGNIKKNGFYDVSDHRKSLPIIYNHYSRTKYDPAYAEAYEDLIMLFRPLFTTSFLLEDFLRSSDFFGSQQIILTSASSKTALGLAFILAHHKSIDNKNIKIIGLTSDKNKSFVESVNYYDEVISYDELDQLSSVDLSMIVDFSGNKSLLLQIDKQLNGQLKYCSTVGLSHWDQRESEGELSVKAELFFAPSQAEKRIAEWGSSGLLQKLGEKWIPFIQSSKYWLEVKHIDNQENLVALYKNMLDGNFDAKAGYIIDIKDFE